MGSTWADGQYRFMCPSSGLHHVDYPDPQRDDSSRSRRVSSTTHKRSESGLTPSFLAIFADVATIAIAYDRAPYARQPVEWQLPKVWIISTILGLLLAAGTWIVRGTLFLDSGGIIQNFGSTQEIIFLEVALTESWVICESSHLP
jgi:H+-transporting ATPase